MTARTILIIGVALAGALPRAAVGWFGRGLAFDRFERPAIVQQGEDACTIRTQDAAFRAEQAERQRQRQVKNDALQVWRDAAQQSERQIAAAQERLAQETKDYEAELLAAGRSCTLDERDIDWLRSQ